MKPQSFSQSTVWLMFVGVLIGALALLMRLPKPYSSIVLLVMLAGSSVLAGYQSRDSLAQLADPLLRGKRRVRQLVLVSSARGSRLLAWLACAMMLFSAFAFRPENANTLELAAALLLIGGVTIGASLWVGRNSGRVLPLPIPADAVLTPTRVRWLPVGAGVLALAALVESNTHRLGVPQLADVSYHVQFALLYAGMILVTWGAAGGGLPRRWTLPRQYRPEVLLVCGLVLAALALRGWQVGGVARFEVDETQFMYAVRTLWEKNNLPILRPIADMFVPYTWFFPYLQIGLIDLFGRNFDGFRMVSVIAGAVTVAGLYALARALFDRTTAVIAALLLLTFPAHLHFSRLALLNIVDAMFGVLSFAGLAWGFKTGKRSYYALGGLALGLTQYFYEGGRLLFPPLALMWLVLGLLMWKQRPRLRGIMTALGVAAVITIPVYFTLISLNLSLTQRMDYNFHLLDNGFHLDVLLARVAEAFLFLVHNPDALFYYYGGHQPLVIEPLVPLFLLGLGYAVWRWRSAGMMLLLLWLVATVCGNSLVQFAGLSPRFVVVFPALALVVAVGMRYVMPLVWPRESGQRTVMMSMAVLLAVVQGVYYFGVHLPAYTQEFWFNRPGPDINDAMLRSSHFPPGTQIHLVNNLLADLYYQNQADYTIRFLADDLKVDVFGPESLTDAYLLSLPQDVDHAFFLTPADWRSLAIVRQYFTVGLAEYSPYPDIPAEEQFVLYYYDAGKTGGRP